MTHFVEADLQVRLNGRESQYNATQPVLTPSEMEDFLLHAPIVVTRRTLKGVTGARQVTLSNGRITHDAQVQDGDIYKAFFEVGPKYTEVNFRDTYRYNIAAYRLARLLDLDNVPMSVRLSSRPEGLRRAHPEPRPQRRTFPPPMGGKGWT